MAASLLKTSSMSLRTKLLHQTGLSLYNTSHGFHEEEVKKKLQQFPGGSIDLQKEDNGIGILTLNNPSKRNAFSGMESFLCLLKSDTNSNLLLHDSFPYFYDIIHESHGTFCRTWKQNLSCEP